MLNLPDNWQWKELQEVAEIGAGNSAPQGDKYFENGIYPFVRTQDLGRVKTTSCLKTVNTKINDLAIMEKKLKLYPPNTLLIPKSGASTFLNHRALLGISSYVTSHLATVISKVNILPKFLYYWSLTIDTRDLTHDISYPSLRLSEIGSAKVPVPPIKTQKKIASILEKAEHLIKWRRDADELTEWYLISVFLEMFGEKWLAVEWEKKKLCELIEPNSSISYGIVQPGDNLEGGVPIIRPIDLKNGKFDINGLKRVDPTIEDKYKYTRLKGNEILISVRGSTGETAITNEKCYGFNVTRGIAVIRPFKVNIHYLNWYLRSPHSSRYIQEHTKGATLRQINLRDLRKLDVLIPPQELQNKFSEVVNQFGYLEKYQKQSEYKINNLFNALMQKAFKGELAA